MHARMQAPLIHWDIRLSGEEKLDSKVEKEKEEEVEVEVEEGKENLGGKKDGAKKASLESEKERERGKMCRVIGCR